MTDRFSMAHSLEARTPLLDHELVELVTSIPPELRTSPDDPKGLLRDAVADLLTPAHLDAPKRGFVFPLARWLRGELRPLAERLLADEHLARQGLFRPGLAARLPAPAPRREPRRERAPLALAHVPALAPALRRGGAHRLAVFHVGRRRRLSGLTAHLLPALVLHLVLGVALTALVWGCGLGLARAAGLGAVFAYPLGLALVLVAAALALTTAWLGIASLLLAASALALTVRRRVRLRPAVARSVAWGSPAAVGLALALGVVLPRARPDLRLVGRR